jgi:hypothetical protein
MEAYSQSASHSPDAAGSVFPCHFPQLGFVVYYCCCFPSCFCVQPAIFLCLFSAWPRLVSYGRTYTQTHKRTLMGTLKAPPPSSTVLLVPAHSFFAWGCGGGLVSFPVATVTSSPCVCVLVLLLFFVNAVFPLSSGETVAQSL